MGVIYIKETNLALLVHHHIIPINWADHPKECIVNECTICSVRDCPFGAIEHYWHDGCPQCYHRSIEWKNKSKSEIPEQYHEAYDILSVEWVMDS